MKRQLLSFFGVRAITLALIIGAASALTIIFRLLQLDFFSDQFLGVLVILAGKPSDYESIKAFMNAGGTYWYTNPPKTVVRTGPFEYVRNPLYLTLFTDTAGLFLYFGSYWYLVLLVLLIAGINIIVIPREESGLEKRFGETYLAYKRAAPRWIPKIPRKR